MPEEIVPGRGGRTDIAVKLMDRCKAQGPAFYPLDVLAQFGRPIGHCLGESVTDRQGLAECAGHRRPRRRIRILIWLFELDPDEVGYRPAHVQCLLMRWESPDSHELTIGKGDVSGM